MQIRSLVCAIAAIAAASPFVAVPAQAFPALSSWTVQASGLTATTLEDVSFPDCLNGWAVGDQPNSSETNVAFDKTEGTIVHTTDGGKTWSAHQTPKALIDLESVFFVDAMHGWIGTNASSGDSHILYTTNAGASWISVLTAGDGDVEAMSFTDALHGFAATSRGYVLKTSNGGVTWARVFQTPAGIGSAHAEAEGITAFDASHAWAASDAGFGAVSIYASINSSTFAAQPSAGSANEAEGLAFVSTTVGWASGEGGLLLHTTNAGGTWTAQAPPAGLTTKDLESIAFPDATHGWFVSDTGDIGTTSNGGTLWSTEASPTINGLQHVVFHTRSRGWAVGNNGTIINRLGPPTIASVTLASGPTAGGTSVTISGCGLTGTTQVKFGNTAGTSVTVVNDATVTVTSPAGAAGPVDVTATTPKGTSQVSAADIFTFVAPAPSPTPALPKAGVTAEAGPGRLVAITWMLLAVFALLSALVARRAHIRG